MRRNAMDSQSVVKSLLAVDPGFEQLCKTLLGDSVDPQEAWDFLYSPERVVKMSPDPSDLHVSGGLKESAKKTVKRIVTKRNALLAGTAAAGFVAGKKLPIEQADDGVEVEYLKSAEDIEDTHDVLWSGEISKVDVEKRQVFGYASVTTIDGEPVVDRQGDFMDIEDIEDAAYEYVTKSRVGGSQHKRDGDQPFHAMDMIESFVITPEKIETMGLPEDTPLGWWTGFKVHDEPTWQDYKDGKKTGFSIHGRGKRVPVEA
jgi:hypothetical protein